LNPGPVRTPMRRQAYPSENLDLLPAPDSITAHYLRLLGSAGRHINGQSLDCQSSTGTDTSPATLPPSSSASS